MWARKEYKEFLMYASLVWFVCGFLVGAIETANNRNGDLETDPQTKVQKYVNPRSGCIYKSVAPFLNPGYVLSCELYRKRFEIEGVEKVLE